MMICMSAIINGGSRSFKSLRMVGYFNRLRLFLITNFNRKIVVLISIKEISCRSFNLNKVITPASSH